MSVVIEDFKSVRAIRLNNPKRRNALSEEMRLTITKAINECPSELEVITLTGTGKAFCAGLDLSEKPNTQSVEEFWQLLGSIYNSSRIVIASLNGVAVGGGLMVANICDVVIAKDSVRIGMPNVNLEAHPDLASPLSVLASHESGQQWTDIKGKLLSSSEAHAQGIIHHLIEDDLFEIELKSMADKISNLPQKELLKIKREVNVGAFNQIQSSGMSLGRGQDKMWAYISQSIIDNRA